MEDYGEAKRCKEMAEALRKRGARIGELEAEKRSAVENEDYDRAK